MQFAIKISMHELVLIYHFLDYFNVALIMLLANVKAHSTDLGLGNALP